MWFRSIITVLASLLQCWFPGTSTVLEYCIILLATIVVMVGYWGVRVTSITFGIDQMPAAPTDEISAFVHWLIWAWFVGKFISDLEGVWYNSTEYKVATIVLALFTATAATFILCTNYFCSGWFVLEPRCRSPGKNNTSVLKYALTHKRPARRSAFAY